MSAPGYEVARCFAENLVRYRHAADLSQEELGFRASLHRTEIGLLERGARIPRIDTVVKLAGALEVEPGDLLVGLSWKIGGFSAGAFRISPSQPQAGEPTGAES